MRERVCDRDEYEDDEIDLKMRRGSGKMRIFMESMGLRAPPDYHPVSVLVEFERANCSFESTASPICDTETHASTPGANIAPRKHT